MTQWDAKFNRNPEHQQTETDADKMCKSSVTDP